MWHAPLPRSAAKVSRRPLFQPRLEFLEARLPAGDVWFGLVPIPPWFASSLRVPNLPAEGSARLAVPPLPATWFQHLPNHPTVLDEDHPTAAHAAFPGSLFIPENRADVPRADAATFASPGARPMGAESPPFLFSGDPEAGRMPISALPILPGDGGMTPPRMGAVNPMVPALPRTVGALPGTRGAHQGGSGKGGRETVIPSQFISKTYTEALGRLPDQGGWQSAVDFYTQNGCSTGTLKTWGRSVYLSNEYGNLAYDNPAK